MQPTAPLALSWAGPFLGVLLSIAVLPAVAARLWHRRMAWVMGLWTAALLLPWAAAFGAMDAARLAWHAVLLEYLPFVTLLLALYAAGGGVLVRGGPAGTPGGPAVVNAAPAASPTIASDMTAAATAISVVIAPTGVRPPVPRILRLSSGA